ncbi:hypothetical protein [Enhygromyxa salina]|uniref:Pyrrolidone-carboxylate peptidase n=1 Tax=Enhygromyxa salina TaxID=215803 RepID=A0A2S9YPF7_9BACT|nr:hypothetical protein [Enhygromyxa salina]PRQ06976.1 hypothetical protein ENSA7_33100 [Enhygromyxa salina]
MGTELAVLGLLGLSALGCSSSVAELDDTARIDGPRAAQVDAARPDPDQPILDHEGQPMRVLVTGFNDWRELGEPPNVWRCRDNPSCRLLLGEPRTSEPRDPSDPRDHAGPLVQRLRAAAPELEWRFATMPVTWEVGTPVPTDVDVIINIGLGVYDRLDALQLEVGAYNLRQGADAAGVARTEPINPDAPAILAAPDGSPIPARIAALTGRTIAGYELLAASARADNSYLCNETHYGALTALHAGEGRLEAVYFLHIPYADSDDYDALADGVAGVVLSLVGRE